MRSRWMSVACTLLLATAAGSAGPLPATPAPSGARVYFIGLEDGAVVQSPLSVCFGLSGMGVAPAGVVKENTGHHHLLIDVDNLPPLDLPLPNDVKHRHFGGGQTEVVVELEPGPHSLQLVLGDSNHIPHQPPIMSERIEIEVK